MQEAVNHFRAALSIRPDFPSAQKNLAFVLATCPDASFRNGAEAIQLAERADELTSGNNASIVGALAAAYAEAGKFPEAIATAQRALRLANAKDSALSNALQSEIKLYQAGLPLRDMTMTNTVPKLR